eukprot:g15552.t1
MGREQVITCRRRVNKEKGRKMQKFAALTALCFAALTASASRFGAPLPQERDEMLTFEDYMRGGGRRGGRGAGDGAGSSSEHARFFPTALASHQTCSAAEALTQGESPVYEWQHVSYNAHDGSVKVDRYEERHQPVLEKASVFEFLQHGTTWTMDLGLLSAEDVKFPGGKSNEKAASAYVYKTFGARQPARVREPVWVSDSEHVDEPPILLRGPLAQVTAGEGFPRTPAAELPSYYRGEGGTSTRGRGGDEENVCPIDLSQSHNGFAAKQLTEKTQIPLPKEPGNAAAGNFPFILNLVWRRQVTNASFLWRDQMVSG